MSQFQNQTQTVAIIGGGFCGTMVAVHLLNQPKMPVHIIMINAGYPISKGVAYSSYSHKHLLNVAAKNMSAFPGKPDHFVQWLLRHENYCALDQVSLPNMFLPRNIYGYYLKDIFENAIRKKCDNVSISFVHDLAIDIELKEHKAHVYFSVSPSVAADKIVLATGNEAPDYPKLQNTSFLNSPFYFSNPWLHEAVNHPDADKEILIIGNGLTMVDVVIGLREKNHRAKIYSLSPNGFRILPHRSFEPYKDLVEELSPPYDFVKVLKLFRRHVKNLRQRGVTGEAAVDSIRPLTQKIWQSLNKRDKERFLYHIRHMWGVARHRLAMHLHLQIQQMILDNKLEIIAGRLLDIKEQDSRMHVTFKRRRDQSIHELAVARVINCTGPQADITRMKNELIQNLLLRKLIEPDELHLGILAESDGTIIYNNGLRSENLFTIGSPLKGILWESTAVPELRMQAKNLADNFTAQHVFADTL